METFHQSNTSFFWWKVWGKAFFFEAVTAVVVAWMSRPGQKVCMSQMCVSMHESRCLSLICQMDRCVDDRIPLQKRWDRDGDRENGLWLAALPWGRGGRRKGHLGKTFCLLSSDLGQYYATYHLWPVDDTSTCFSHHPSVQITLCVSPLTQPGQTLRDVATLVSHLQGRRPAREGHTAQYLHSLMKLQDGCFGG